MLDGRHDTLLPAEWDTTHRWSTRLYADDDLDLWLISWTPGEATELHDHAGSLGALTVLSGGSLREYHWTGGTIWLCAFSMPATRPPSRSDGCTTS